MIYLAALAIATGFGVPIAVLSAAIAQARTASSAVESMARQPEVAGQIQTAMIIALAFIEALVIYGLLMFFMLQGKLPGAQEALEAIKTAAGGG